MNINEPPSVFGHDDIASIDALLSQGKRTLNLTGAATNHQYLDDAKKHYASKGWDVTFRANHGGSYIVEFTRKDAT